MHLAPLLTRECLPTRTLPSASHTVAGALAPPEQRRRARGPTAPLGALKPAEGAAKHATTPTRAPAPARADPGAAPAGALTGAPPHQDHSLAAILPLRGRRTCAPPPCNITPLPLRMLCCHTCCLASQIDPKASLRPRGSARLLQNGPSGGKICTCAGPGHRGRETTQSRAALTPGCSLQKEGRPNTTPAPRPRPRVAANATPRRRQMDARGRA